MIDHTGVRVSDLARSRAFYEAALAPLGYDVRLAFDKAVGLGVAADVAAGGDPGGDFWITQGEPNRPPMHVAFRARNREEVEAFHRAALRAGGTDHGAPGFRPQYHEGYYAAFVLDPDGHNIEAVCHLSL